MFFQLWVNLYKHSLKKLNNNIMVFLLLCLRTHLVKENKFYVFTPISFFIVRLIFASEKYTNRSPKTSLRKNKDSSTLWDSLIKKLNMFNVNIGAIVDMLY
ncbi:hypothetical protein BpHYR1_047532 [Brachionus plicatilis]|uniref:Uncharacterized protein n=1 Tax=Brachionus plicatilis TaxID=10195 RepID=A0A3M7QU47_BRAPC|nr:hypothetical protein BpHYR1_047532 [Brachionus plicatilis]